MNGISLEDAPALVTRVSKRDHIRGPEIAPITLLEYGDYECPYCGMAHGMIEVVREALGDRMRFVYRHFPLTQIHPHAMGAAAAAEASGKQGKFWEMHDLLFERQDQLGEFPLLDWAAELGLDMEQFERDLRSRDVALRIQEDRRSGIRSGVNGTPTLFVQGYRYNGPLEAAALLSAIEAAAE